MLRECILLRECAHRLCSLFSKRDRWLQSASIAQNHKGHELENAFLPVAALVLHSCKNNIIYPHCWCHSSIKHQHHFSNTVYLLEFHYIATTLQEPLATLCFLQNSFLLLTQYNAGSVPHFYLSLLLHCIHHLYSPCMHCCSSTYSYLQKYACSPCPHR